MRWPIRNQILLPFLLIQGVAIIAIALATSWVAVMDAEVRIEAQLRNVSATLEQASFPLTSNVLDQLHSLSGADFLIVDHEGFIVETTISKRSTASMDLSDQSWQRVGDTGPVGSDTLRFGNEDYFAERVSLSNGQGGRHVFILFPQADWRAARWDAMRPPLLIGSLLLSLTVVFSIVLSRWLGSRIHHVQSQVARIANGNFKPISPSATDDELRDLAISVNQMAKALEASRQRDRDNERSTLLTQLVGGLAHQFRNAITGARVSVQLHQRRCLIQDDEALDVALRQLELTEQQIKALLRVTRGEERSRVSGDVSSLVEEAATLVKPICEHHQITIRLQTDSGDWEVSDADGLRCALLSLMMNAVEATGPHGQIEIATHDDSGRARITIADDGPGFPKADDIFQSFFSTKREGIGLGLPLARQAVEDCGGSLTARREQDRTVFEIQFGVTGCVDETTPVSISPITFRAVGVT